MDVDVAGDVDAARQPGGVVLALRLQLAGHGGHVAVIPDSVGAADGQPRRVHGDAHRLVERPEVGVDRARLGVIADEDDLARLIGADDEADAGLLQDVAEGTGVDASQGIGLGLAGRFD